MTKLRSFKGNEDRYLSFTLGEEEFAIPLLAVKEVIAIPPLTPVPHSPGHFLGLTNLRGLVIPVIDLGTKLALKKTPDHAESAVIICEVPPYHLGIRVDAVNAVIAPGAEELSLNPEAPGSGRRDFIAAIYRREKSLVLLLDIIKVLDAFDSHLIEQAANTKQVV